MPSLDDIPTNSWKLLLPVSSSEAASLKGKPAKTPIIAGTVCGVAVLLGWIIGFTIYFRKRSRRKKLVAAGIALPVKNKREDSEQKIIVPPDPAVLSGQRKPGEYIIPPAKPSSARPLLETRATYQVPQGTTNGVRPSMEHAHSAPPPSTDLQPTSTAGAQSPSTSTSQQDQS